MNEDKSNSIIPIHLFIPYLNFAGIFLVSDSLYFFAVAALPLIFISLRIQPASPNFSVTNKT